MRQRDSFSNRVRQALMRLSGRSVDGRVVNADLSEALDLVGTVDKRPMYAALKDLRKAGEVERVAPGIHVYIGKPSGGPDIRAAMWSVVRMRKRFTIADLQELAGASKEYAKEYVILLVRRGVVERIGRPGGTYIYRLLHDPGTDPPENDERAARLRRVRAAKKAAVEGLDQAGRAIIAATKLLMAARIAVADIPEEEESSCNALK